MNLQFKYSYLPVGVSIMLKRTILFTLISVLCVFSLPAKAQENAVIAYGQKVTGEVTNKKFEIPFDFKGKKGDVFIIEMKSDSSSDFASPEIVVLNSNGDVEGDSKANASYGSTFFIGQISKDDTFTILASRADGRSGDGAGSFSLSLYTPVQLKLGEAMKDTSTSAISKYYLIKKDKGDMSLTYKKSSGKFSPEVSINVSNDTYGLDKLVSLAGDDLFEVQTKLPDQQGWYIVKVSEALFDFNFTEINATYQLQIDTPK